MLYHRHQQSLLFDLFKRASYRLYAARCDIVGILKRLESLELICYKRCDVVCGVVVRVLRAVVFVSARKEDLDYRSINANAVARGSDPRAPGLLGFHIEIRIRIARPERQILLHRQLVAAPCLVSVIENKI